MSDFFETLTPSQLLQLHGSALDELDRRGITRSQNAPLGDYTEYLVCHTYGFEMAANSVKSYDATDENKVRYQIKSRRRVGAGAKAGRLSSLRSFDFDFLIGALFNPDYTISRAAKIPVDVVKENCGISGHTNSHIFHLRDSVWELDQVEDVTLDLIDGQRAIDAGI